MANIMNELGQVVATKGVSDRMENDPEFWNFVYASLGRYVHQDWGDTPEEDKEQIESALKNGERIMAVYNRPGHEDDTIWIITEWDRSVTTILFPEEY